MSGVAEHPWRRTLDRWSAVLRYHRPQQLARRFWNRVREKLPIGETSIEGPTPKMRAEFVSLFSAIPERQRGELERHSDGSCHRSSRLTTLKLGARQVSTGKHLAAIRSGNVRLLNREYALGWPPRWDDAEREGMPLLAVFHLHYHEHLLKIVHQEPEAVWAAITSWIGRFSSPDHTSAGWSAWHPYCISRRIFVWPKLLALAPPESVRTDMRHHLAKQARRLAGRFERDIGGNHLWENARALAALGAIFQGDEADDWRRQGLTTLWQCLQDQLSPEGEHFERSPMYQAELAHGLVELAAVIDAVDPESAARCLTNAIRMSDFLDRLRHPDGGLPLFGDTTRDEELSGMLVEGASSPISSWQGDYFVHRDEHGFLLFDAGDVGPDHLPAHAHSDLLGFEASAFSKRLFVDSGVYSYSGPRREEFRKAAAHNVLTIDGVELADVWGSFRVGRRGHVVSRQSGRSHGVQWIKSEHDAYRRLGVRVQRWWLIGENGAVWISIHAVLGRGDRQLKERLHLHPEVVWTRIAESVNLQIGGGELRWALASPMGLRIETTAYSERFHEERPKTTLVMEQWSELPAVSAWGMAFGAAEFQASAKIVGNRLVVHWTLDGAERRFERMIDG